MEDCIMLNDEFDGMSCGCCLEKEIIEFKGKIKKLNMLHDNDKKLLKDEMLKIVDIIKRYAPDKFKRYENLLEECPDIFKVRYELTVEDSLAWWYQDCFNKKLKIYLNKNRVRYPEELLSKWLCLTEACFFRIKIDYPSFGLFFGSLSKSEAEKKINDVAIDEDHFCPVSGRPLRIFFKGLFGIDGVYDDVCWNHQCPKPKNIQ